MTTTTTLSPAKGKTVQTTLNYYLDPSQGGAEKDFDSDEQVKRIVCPEVKQLLKDV